MNLPATTLDLMHGLMLAVDASAPPKVGFGALAALGLFIVGSMWIGVLANRAMQSPSFMKGFFLGNRGLGSWALALTATVQSGGTFMGYPSLVYTHGWVVALWIAGYMVVPITGFGILGKRLAQISRKSNALTVPDIFRERFNSPMLGLLASLAILFFMSVMMIAQFKAGATVMKLAWPWSDSLVLSEDAATNLDIPYWIGLGVFTVTVVGYTLLGGFLAAVWTDLFQSVMMAIGVVLLLVLAVNATGGMEPATVAAMKATGPEYAFGPGYDPRHVGRLFLPVTLAISFFCNWVFSGVGSPAGMVRIMACKDTETIRRSIYLLSFYNGLIYIPLVVICVCGRALIPDLPAGKEDEIIPRLAITLTSGFPIGSFWGGMILAAPFGAVMATVSSYLVVIASGLVRDVYQRFINPEANEYMLSRLSWAVMIIVGLIAVGFNIRPVAFLQVLVVFSGTGAAATFCVPVMMLAYWRRSTKWGVLAAMLAGGLTQVGLYAIGIFELAPDMATQNIGAASKFRPYFLLGFDPLMWSLPMSLICGVVVSLLTRPPELRLVHHFFDVPVHGYAPVQPAQQTVPEATRT